MVHAATFGHIDYETCDGTARWWIGARMKLHAVEDALYLRVRELQAHRAIGVQAMTDLSDDTEYRQKFAMEAIQRVEKESMPWLGAAKEQNDQNTALDAMAAWYAVFGKQYGVL